MDVFGQLKRKQMKNLILSTLLITLSYTSFSQTVIDTTSIRLAEPVVKLVIKDLIKGDASEREAVVLSDVIKMKTVQITKQDTIILSLNLQLDNFRKAFQLENDKFDTSQKLSKELQQALKKANRQKKLYKIGSIVGAVAVGILIVQ